MTEPIETPSIPPVRILVQDGKWCVPPEQRPKNWREILPEPKTKKAGKK
jgi:hypothetical protein